MENAFEFWSTRCSLCENRIATTLDRFRHIEAGLLNIYARQAIVEADVLLVGLEVPIETAERAIHLAHEAGVQVLLNPAPGQLLSTEILRLVDVLTPTRQRPRSSQTCRWGTLKKRRMQRESSWLKV